MPTAASPPTNRAASLGLDAQKQAVASFVVGRGTILKEFIEVESGKRNDQPQLAEALAMCRQRKARLVIAKLDRLVRNVHFIGRSRRHNVFAI